LANIIQQKVAPDGNMAHTHNLLEAHDGLHWQLENESGTFSRNSLIRDIRDPDIRLTVSCIELHALGSCRVIPQNSHDRPG
jgi:hypothetical protein